MPTRPKPTLNLRTLILLIALLSAVTTLANSFWVIYKVQKQELISNALDNNKDYASRIAAGIEQVLSSDIEKLKYSAGVIGRDFDNQGRLDDEALRLLKQDSSFNSILVANTTGTVVTSAPESLNISGQALRDKEPLQSRVPKISNSFKSIAGNLVIFISYPVFGARGEYLGLIGGTVRLDQENALNTLVDQHVRHDGAHVYLVDRTRRVLYHPQPDNIGAIIGDDAIVDAVLQRKNGTLQAHDASGIEMLAGFETVSSSGWGVVSQQPLNSTLAMLNKLMNKVGLGIAPVGLLGLVLIWWSGTKIASPLSMLAKYAKRLDAPESYKRISAVSAFFNEAWQIRRALLFSVGLLQEKIGRLNRQAQSDALTGLANRRAMQDALTLWEETGQSFAVVSLDIDHFKRVNDSFGHGVGDDTLRVVADLMKQNSRENDLPCRVGGEEFVLLLPNSSLRTAAEVAERLRASIERTTIETVGHITVSFGVALWTPEKASVAAVFEKADKLLYQAKQQGRNRVVVEEMNLPERT
ncbi:sensor domain-containing diguanylate cyclase [Pseudomonas sp. MWU13-2105]|uniref:sensor domain-containing diguanylate cyclase n=1 Tax=Pseudomonas sp. MWU13-2105 TaxID=2935074 RepID=UPI00200E1944|nr:sensor domain-containing diguanylate cyclase [Pseudomonas sp. MWU13-2105]